MQFQRLWYCAVPAMALFEFDFLNNRAGMRAGNRIVACRCGCRTREGGILGR
jgi:hypothetical protein